jgi:hypothetical protein
VIVGRLQRSERFDSGRPSGLRNCTMPDTICWCGRRGSGDETV